MIGLPATRMDNGWVMSLRSLRLLIDAWRGRPADRERLLKSHNCSLHGGKNDRSALSNNRGIAAGRLRLAVKDNIPVCKAANQIQRVCLGLHSWHFATDGRRHTLQSLVRFERAVHARGRGREDL